GEGNAAIVKLAHGVLLAEKKAEPLWVRLLFQAEDGIRDGHVTGVQTCALPIYGDRATFSAGNVARSPSGSIGCPPSSFPSLTPRSEERRVGKEWTFRWARGHRKKTRKEKT